MKEKLLELMKSEDLRPGQLAEMLGVNPAGISHILAGRNKPGFDLLQKILNRFPQINPDWLIMDKGPMYREDFAAAGNTTATSEEGTEDLFSNRTTTRCEGNAPRPTIGGGIMAADFLPAASTCHGKVRKIVIFYEDGTFESFSPVQ